MKGHNKTKQNNPKTKPKQQPENGYIKKYKANKTNKQKQTTRTQKQKQQETK